MVYCSSLTTADLYRLPIVIKLTSTIVPLSFPRGTNRVLDLVGGTGIEPVTPRV